MKNLRVGKKLFVSFITVIVLATVIGVAGILGTLQTNSYVSELYLNQVIPIREKSYAREYFQRLRSEQRNLIINYGDPEAILEIRTEIERQFGQFNAYMENFRRYIISDVVMELFNIAMSETHNYVQLMERMAAVAENPDAVMADVREIAAAAPTYSRPAEEALVQIGIIRAAQSEAVFNASEAMSRLTLIAIFSTLTVSIIVSVIVAKSLSTSIVPPLGAMTSFFKRAAEKGTLECNESELEVLKKFRQNKDELGLLSTSLDDFMREIIYQIELLTRIADGDINFKPHILSEEDVIGQSLTTVVDSLNYMFGEINAASEQVASGSKQIANGAQTLAKGTTEQAASVVELSSTIADISEQTKGNADMALKAAKLAGAIKINAEKGSGQMDEMVKAVSDINIASQNISKVLKAIDDIAFQTNILALNAAVEAARAGQHGKGFAVVAEEVRTLAAKSAEAARDTGSLISNSREKAEYGSKIARETADSLAEIVKGINESREIIAEIAASSESQSAGITQINLGIDQVADVITHNSATSEESSAAAEELSRQSDVLKSLLLRFRLLDQDIKELSGASS